MSDRPFPEKQTITGGFADSHFRINNYIATLKKWDEEEILNRSKMLAERVISIWQYPVVSQSDIDEYLKKDKPEVAYISIEHYQRMSPEIEAIYEELDCKIIALDSGIRKEYKKDYIAYKVDTNFVDVEPYKGHLKMWLNMPFEEITDPKGLCTDVSHKGHMGNGNAEIKFSESDNIDYIIGLATQALTYQLDE